MMIKHREREVVLMIFAMHRLALEIAERVMHPTHVPLEGKAQTEADEKSEKAVEDFFPGTGFAENWERGVHALIVCGLASYDRKSRFRCRHSFFTTKGTKVHEGNTYKSNLS